MLLNRALPWADVYSFIPYQGRVEIKVHQTCKNVQVHAPEWIVTGSNEITVQVSGQPRLFHWKAPTWTWARSRRASKSSSGARSANGRLWRRWAG